MVSAPTKPPLAPTIVPGASTTLRLPAEWKLTPDCLIELAALNEALFFERTAEGALVITGPPGNLSSKRGFAIGLQIGNWALARDSGDAGAADEGYELPDSSVRTPDFSWVSGERLAEIEVSDEGVWRVCPDFVLEVRSRGQSVPEQQRKMERWMANGVRLGWLVDAFTDSVWVYREGQPEPERLERPMILSGESVMEGLSVDLTHVWRPTAPRETPGDA